MNCIDLIIILVLGMYAFHGWRRGLLLIALDFIGLVVSLACALLFFRHAAPLLAGMGLGPSLSKGVAFLAVFALAQFGFWFVAVAVYRALPKSAKNSLLNRWLGIIPSVTKGFVLCSLMVMILVVLPTRIPHQLVLDSPLGSRMLRVSSAVERAAASLFSGAVQEGLTFLTIERGASDSVRIRAQTKDVAVDFDAEEEMLKLVNSERTRRGLNPLRMDARLRTLARKHSRDMFARGYFAHVNPDGKSPFDRMRQASIDYEEAGENLAMAPSVTIAHDGLMRSPGHRANILDPKFGRIGIGVCSSEIYGKVFSQEFTD